MKNPCRLPGLRDAVAKIRNANGELAGDASEMLKLLDLADTAMIASGNYDLARARGLGARPLDAELTDWISAVAPRFELLLREALRLGFEDGKRLRKRLPSSWRRRAER